MRIRDNLSKPLKIERARLKLSSSFTTVNDVHSRFIFSSCTIKRFPLTQRSCTPWISKIAERRTTTCPSCFVQSSMHSGCCRAVYSGRRVVHSYKSRFCIDFLYILRSPPLCARGIWKRRVSVLVWTENILKKELFENNGVTIIVWFPSPRFPQTQIQNYRWFLRFLNPSDVVWRKNIWCVFRVKPPFSNFSSVVWTENIWCVYRVKPPFSISSGVVWTENIWCVFRVKPLFSNSSSVVWTKNIWCVFRVKPPFLNSSSVVWTENIWCVFRVKSPFSNSSNVVWTENIWCVFRVKPLFLNCSSVVWTENIWCVFRVKPPFSNSSSVVWTENIWCVFRVKPPFLNSSSVVWTENIWCVYRVKPLFSNFSSVVWTERDYNDDMNSYFATCTLFSSQQVAYYGDPAVAPSIFLKAYFQSTSEEYRSREDAPNIDTTNPAGKLFGFFRNIGLVVNGLDLGVAVVRLVWSPGWG